MGFDATGKLGKVALPLDEINAKKIKELENWKRRFEECEFKSIDVLADTNDEQNDRLDALEEKTKELDDVSWDKDTMYEWAKTELSNLGEAIKNLLKPLENKIEILEKKVKYLEADVFPREEYEQEGSGIWRKK